MDKLDKKIIIDDFMATIINEFEDIETILSFLRIDNDKDKIMINEAISLFKKKFKKIKKANSIKEVDKYIDVKKIIKEHAKLSYIRNEML